ncbi:uncharacterized protein Dvar_72430 [Desulfosarcina variabilis str. Montpellier]|uniref:hypothetical protein n=1 Tax=Desulfosarcina variabilis TaxID=2300 RepID=UPI003AFB3B5F
MNDSINRLFAFDSGIYNLEEIFNGITTNQIGINNNLITNENSDFIPSAMSTVSGESLEYQIEKIILSVIDDMENIDTNKFSVLLEKTLLAIKHEIENVQDSKIQQSLTDLVELLMENTNLASLFQSYSNWLQKA